MSIVYINTGTSANAGDGDSIRTAFNKVNTNLRTLETYIAEISSTTNITEFIKDTQQQTLVHPNHVGLTSVYNTLTEEIVFTVGGTVENLTVSNNFAIDKDSFNIDGKVLTVTTANTITIDGIVVSGSGETVVGETPPTEYSTGTVWYDTISGRTFVRYDNSWVDSFGSLGPSGPRGPSGPIGPSGPQGIKGDTGNEGFKPTRVYLTVEPNSVLPPGESSVYDARLGYKSVSLIKIRCPEYVRVRIYSSNSARTADYDRPVEEAPAVNIGLIFETVGDTTYHVLTPGLIASNTEEPATDKFYFTFSNTSGSVFTLPNADLVFLGLEST
jgi:hypothetical protein